MKRLSLTPFNYPNLTKPHGALSSDSRSQACWYFYSLAHKVYEMVGKSIEDQFGVLDDELWMDKRYVQIARSVAMQYGLESPDEFAKAWDEVRLQAIIMGLPAPRDEYTRLAPGIVRGAPH